MEENEKMLKLLMTTGQAFHVFADMGTIDEVSSHPKFLRTNDGNNDVFISIENIMGFEVVDKQSIEELKQNEPETKVQ